MCQCVCKRDVVRVVVRAFVVIIIIIIITNGVAGKRAWRLSKPPSHPRAEWPSQSPSPIRRIVSVLGSHAPGVASQCVGCRGYDRQTH